MIPELSQEMLEAVAKNEEHARLIKELQLCSYIAVPLLRQGSAFGVITLAMAESNRHYGPEDLSLAQALAERTAAAVENAKLYEEAKAARTQALLANRSKDEFLAMLGHELRNPLAPILSALELMRLDARYASPRQRVIIERQVEHLVRLVDDLLDVSRITRGRLSLSRRPVAMERVVRHALEMVQPLLEHKRHPVKLDIDPGIVVNGDAVRLAQVVANLLTNAAKYTPADGRIQLSAQHSAEGVKLVISDDGIGIDAEMLTQIFDRFVQEPQALDRAHGGLGLGLAIVRGLVELHGGQVSATSGGAGRGAEFVVTLPVFDGPESEVPEPLSEPGSKSLRILVVDDNADALEMLSELLSALGHQPFTASDGAQGLAVAQEQQLDLALLDIGLPKIDGYELGRQIHASPELSELPLVALTGYGQAADRKRSAAAGFIGHLVKPVSLDGLQAILSVVSKGSTSEPSN